MDVEPPVRRLRVIGAGADGIGLLEDDDKVDYLDPLRLRMVRFELFDRVDLALLLELGTCPFPLVHVSNDPLGVMVHDLGEHGEALAREHALANPITMSMRHLFAREWRDLGGFLSAMLAEDSAVLLVRAHNALHALEGSADPDLSAWVEKTLSVTILPDIERLLKEPAQAQATPDHEKKKSVRSGSAIHSRASNGVF